MSAEIIFNHDGFGLLAFLATTAMTEQDAAELLVLPLHKVGVTTIDWCIMSTAHHNCRTRHDLAFDGRGQGRRIDSLIGRVVTYYNQQRLDLLDIVIKHGHACGMKVLGNIRLNHSSLEPQRLRQVPGRSFGDRTLKKDFRDERFHIFLCDLFEDLLEKGVDGIVLDFERKTPFFPPEARPDEKFEACRSFVSRVRALTDKTVAVRCTYQAEKGAAEGQEPVEWMNQGLVDAVIPATHNHEPDRFDWTIERLVEAARQSPRVCRAWPQLWPTSADWAAEGSGHKERHSPEAVRQRCRDLMVQGADGVYFFNFCCDGWPCPPDFGQSGKNYEDMNDIFTSIAEDKARNEAIFSGLPQLLAKHKRVSIWP